MKNIHLHLCILVTFSSFDAYEGYEETNPFKEGSYSEEELKLKSDKALPIFNLVRFANGECNSTDPILKCGTCYSKEDCDRNGGTAAGKCASGFGVCCVLKVDFCGGTVDKNLTYIQSPNFPANFEKGTEDDHCYYVIQPINEEICSIRLDFEEVELSIDVTNGNCDFGEDALYINVPNGHEFLAEFGICGRGLDGQHIYMDTNGLTTAVLDFEEGSDNDGLRNWNIKVTQIECNSLSLPPQGCAQYYTGQSGIYESLNWGQMVIVSPTHYRSCFRQEEGFCSIAFTVSDDDSFQLAGNAGGSQTADTSPCDSTTFLLGVRELCGTKLNSGFSQTVNGVVESNVHPFEVYFHNEDAFNINNQPVVKGFSLKYTQVPC